MEKNIATRGRTGDQLLILIRNGKYTSKEDMMAKLDVFLMGDRITIEEYELLVKELEIKEAEKNPPA